MVQFAWSEIFMTLRELFKKGYKDSSEKFSDIAKEILRDGFYKYKIDKTASIDVFDIVDYFCEKEILFFEPQNSCIYANSRVYKKAFERFIK